MGVGTFCASPTLLGLSVPSRAMKKIEVVVDPHTLHSLKEALGELGITGLTVTEVRGLARKETHNEIYRGSEYTVDLLPKLKVEVFLPDGELEDVVAAILGSSQNGKITR